MQKNDKHISKVLSLALMDTTNEFPVEQKKKLDRIISKAHGPFGFWCNDHRNWHTIFLYWPSW